MSNNETPEYKKLFMVNRHSISGNNIVDLMPVSEYLQPDIIASLNIHNQETDPRHMDVDFLSDCMEDASQVIITGGGDPGTNIDTNQRWIQQILNCAMDVNVPVKLVSCIEPQLSQWVRYVTEYIYYAPFMSPNIWRLAQNAALKFDNIRLMTGQHVSPMDIPLVETICPITIRRIYSAKDVGYDFICEAVKRNPLIQIIPFTYDKPKFYLPNNHLYELAGIYRDKPKETGIHALPHDDQEE